MKPDDLLPGARVRTNCERSEALRIASTELRFVSETLRAEARELVATSGDIRKRSEEVMEACMNLQRRPESPQAAHSLSTAFQQIRKPSG